LAVIVTVPPEDEALAHVPPLIALASRVAMVDAVSLPP
jgi:hypothetical protein